MATYALKVRDDDPIAVFMDKQPNKSEFLKELVQAYLDAHSGKPGVNPPQTPPSPDEHWIEALEAAVYRGSGAPSASYR